MTSNRAALSEREALPWVGVDMGGSGARLWRVERQAESNVWCTRGGAIRFDWEPSSWRPASLEAQRAEFGTVLPREELEEGESRIARLADSIRALAGDQSVRLAIAAPGLRCEDERGLRVVRNGPRLPGLLDQLETGVPIEAGFLTGDGWAGAMGEFEAVGGSLAGTRHSLYLGGGTGLAEALVVDGEVRELEGDWRRAWQLPMPAGGTLEDSLAPFRMRADPRLYTPDGALCIDRVLERLRLYVELRGEEYESRQGHELERLVVGQGLADLLSGVPLPRARWSERVVLSSLRAAPALGAVALAVHARDAFHA